MIGGGLVIIMTALTVAGEPASWSELAQSFALGPVAPQVDLRNMLTRHVVRRSCVLLDEVAAKRRQEIAAGDWQKWRDGIRRAMGPMPFGAAGGPLNVRAVSRHERPGYVVENVLFESLPGLDVNGSVYLPLDGMAARTLYAEGLKRADTFRLECNDARGAIKAFVGKVESMASN